MLNQRPILLIQLTPRTLTPNRPHRLHLQLRPPLIILRHHKTNLLRPPIKKPHIINPRISNLIHIIFQFQYLFRWKYVGIDVISSSWRENDGEFRWPVELDVDVVLEAFDLGELDLLEEGGWEVFVGSDEAFAVF